MKKMLVNWVLSALGLYFIGYLFSGIQIDGFATALIAALVFGLVNALIKPVIKILSLPLTIITFGFFSLIVNALMLSLTSFLVAGFTISSFGTAFLAAIVLSLLNMIFIDKNDKD